MSRMLYRTHTGSKGGSILDSTNPMDLLNKLKRGTALDDATNPTDAIDAALRELNAQTPQRFDTVVVLVLVRVMIKTF